MFDQLIFAITLEAWYEDYIDEFLDHHDYRPTKAQFIWNKRGCRCGSVAIFN